MVNVSYHGNISYRITSYNVCYTKLLRRAQNQTGSTSAVKKVQSAKPDWSKARGARPASVERPSGSRIPKGAGRPGGAKGPGRR